eukprot:ctg_483.g140
MPRGGVDGTSPSATERAPLGPAAEVCESARAERDVSGLRAVVDAAGTLTGVLAEERVNANGGGGELVVEAADGYGAGAGARPRLCDRWSWYMQTSARLLFHRTQRNERDGATEGRQGSAVAGLFEDERRSALDAVRWRFGSREPLDREGAAVMEAGRLTRKREGGDPGQQGDATAAAGRGKRARRTPRSGGRTEAPAAGAAKAVRNKSRLLDAQLLRGVRVWLIGESASAEGDDSVVKRLEALGAIVVPTDDRWEEVVQFAPATEDVDEVVANGDAAANRTVLVVAPTRWNWWDVLQQRSLESVEDAELQAQLATARLMLDQATRCCCARLKTSARGKGRRVRRPHGWQRHRGPGSLPPQGVASKSPTHRIHDACSKAAPLWCLLFAAVVVAQPTRTRPKGTHGSGAASGWFASAAERSAATMRRRTRAARAPETRPQHECPCPTAPWPMDTRHVTDWCCRRLRLEARPMPGGRDRRTPRQPVHCRQSAGSGWCDAYRRTSCCRRQRSGMRRSLRPLSGRNARPRRPRPPTPRHGAGHRHVGRANDNDALQDLAPAVVFARAQATECTASAARR